MKDSGFIEESDTGLSPGLAGKTESATLAAAKRSTGNLLGSCYDIYTPRYSPDISIEIQARARAIDADTGVDFLTGGDSASEPQAEDNEVEDFEAQIILSAESDLLGDGYNLDDDDDDEDVGDDGTIVYGEDIQASQPASIWRPTSGDIHHRVIQERHGDEGDAELRSQWSVSAAGFMSEEKSIAAFEEAVIAQRLFKQLGAKNSRYSDHSYQSCYT